MYCPVSTRHRLCASQYLPHIHQVFIPEFLTSLCSGFGNVVTGFFFGKINLWLAVQGSAISLVRVLNPCNRAVSKCEPLDHFAVLPITASD